MAFQKVLELSELPAGTSKVVKLGNKKVALFNYNGKITALGNACLHRGGPLGLGCVEKKTMATM
ncbi:MULTISPECIES: Rieske (2Fe-2S) protein [unclassified Paraflavitalea]|jgi:nitrite reductase/ring-hydroxylating ferredoxin subunit|uniref:Rieske (2Fe-2S) protein n=1 Tax=unclassified Paraflavitalea TaxID=2798305 RepID=UPI003D332275